ncbi:hypothetical protein COP2_003653 [Malus domestica]
MQRMMVLTTMSNQRFRAKVELITLGLKLMIIKMIIKLQMDFILEHRETAASRNKAKIIHMLSMNTRQNRWSPKWKWLNWMETSSL